MKRSLKSVSFWLVVLTTVLSTAFAIVYNWAKGCYYTDPYFSKAAYDATHYLEAGFSSLSLFVCYGIIIYSYARYSADKAKFSFVYLGLNLAVYFITQMIFSFSDTSFQAQLSSIELYERTNFVYISVICVSIGQILIEYVLPAILIAFITCKVTKNGIERVSGFISWKNTIQRAMIISTLAIFGINVLLLLGITVLPYLISQAFYITLNAFIDVIIIPIIEKLVFSLILQYSVYMLMYFLCNKYGETNGLTQKTDK